MRTLVKVGPVVSEGNGFEIFDRRRNLSYKLLRAFGLGELKITDSKTPVYEIYQN